MVPVCQISLVTLSALSSYLLLYVCAEHQTRLCQNIRRGRGENDNQNFLRNCIFSPSTQRVALGGTGWDGHWAVCVKASALQGFVLPDTNMSSPRLRALQYLLNTSQDHPRAHLAAGRLFGSACLLCPSAPPLGSDPRHQQHPRQMQSTGLLHRTHRGMLRRRALFLSSGDELWCCRWQDSGWAFPVQHGLSCSTGGFLGLFFFTFHFCCVSDFSYISDCIDLCNKSICIKPCFWAAYVGMSVVVGWWSTCFQVQLSNSCKQ